MALKGAGVGEEFVGEEVETRSLSRNVKK
ncbi:hypothetical protein CCACVL1_07737, partial [Corchorus capsularis]